MLKDFINIHKQSVCHWKATTQRQSRLINIHKTNVCHWDVTKQRHRGLINIHKPKLRRSRIHDFGPGSGIIVTGSVFSL